MLTCFTAICLITGDAALPVPVAVGNACDATGAVNVLIGSLPLTPERKEKQKFNINIYSRHLVHLLDVTVFDVVVVRTCNFPSGICTSCCPGLRPRTLTLPSGPRIICTLCGVGAGVVDVAFDCEAFAAGEALAVDEAADAELRANCVVACCMMRVVPSGFLTITRLLPITCPLTAGILMMLIN